MRPMKAGGSLGNMFHELGHYFDEKRSTKKYLVVSGNVNRFIVKFLGPNLSHFYIMFE